jgi:hypothetical protein
MPFVLRCSSTACGCNLPDIGSSNRCLDLMDDYPGDSLVPTPSYVMAGFFGHWFTVVEMAGHAEELPHDPPFRFGGFIPAHGCLLGLLSAVRTPARRRWS